MARHWKILVLVALAFILIVFTYYLRAIFMPLFVAAILAYIVNPVLNALEARGVRRLVSILGVYAILGGVLAAAVFWAIPAGMAEAREFVRDLTAPNGRLQKVMVWGDARLKDWLGAENWDQAIQNLKTKISGREGEIAQAGGKVVGGVLSFMTQSIGSFIAVFSFIALVPVYLFFLMKNMNPWWERVKHSIPRSYRDPAISTLGKIHRAIASFFRGQLTISSIEGVIVFLCLWILGVKLSLLFGAIYAILSLVPFLGPVLGFTITQVFVLADTGSFGSTFWMVTALFGAVQVLESVLLQPMILGKETGLHPIAIILSLLLCAELFGFFGMLIGVPVASTVKIMLDDYVWPMFEEVADLTRVIPRPPTNSV